MVLLGSFYCNFAIIKQMEKKLLHLESLLCAITVHVLNNNTWNTDFRNYQALSNVVAIWMKTFLPCHTSAALDWGPLVSLLMWPLLSTSQGRPHQEMQIITLNTQEAVPWLLLSLHRCLHGVKRRGVIKIFISKIFKQFTQKNDFFGGWLQGTLLSKAVSE